MNPAEPASRVVGLYSFPKSGNTWIRNIIAAMMGVPNEPHDLQRYGRVIDNPWKFQDADWYFYKCHNKQVLTEHQDQSFVTDRIVYIYRHPLDVFVSYLNFVSKNVSPQAGLQLGISFDRVEDLTAAQMERLFSLYTAHGTLFPQNRLFGSLLESVNNFRELRERGGQVHILRYEDLVDNFHQEAERIAAFVGFTDIDTQKVYEMADKGTAQNGKFFWKRQKENYRNYLTQDQIDRFWLVYEEQLVPMGYTR